MQITSLVFICFFFVIMLLYYLLPLKIKKYQWVVLLVSSLVFYVLCSTWGIFFVLITAVSIYFAALQIDKISEKQKQYLSQNKETLSKEQKKEFKSISKRNKKRIMVATIILNVGILCVFKYSHFVIDQINGIAAALNVGRINNDFTLLTVLGISFYTFQSVGYLVDVYWENASAQKDFLKMLLFVSFFPQVTQGPISDYNELSGELFKEHEFKYENFSWGIQRFLWGLFKKLVIADYIGAFVLDAFSNYNSMSGLACLIMAFGYSIQIYADFSGYMDMMCGLCQMLDIRLAENFERPYFSKSVAEYWRRWHITLGVWFKKYIYYPIGISKWNRNLGKKCECFGKAVSENLPATLALIVVWFVTGLWHGASWAYIAWGGVNGLFIIFSMWMEPVYEGTKKRLNIDSQSFLWRAFQVIRTFVLITFIKVLPEVGTLSDGFGFIGRIFTNFDKPSSIVDILPMMADPLESPGFFFGVVVLFIFSLIQRKHPVRYYLNKIPMVLRVFLLALLVILILVFGVAYKGQGGFMYARF